MDRPTWTCWSASQQASPTSTQLPSSSQQWLLANTPTQRRFLKLHRCCSSSCHSADGWNTLPRYAALSWLLHSIRLVNVYFDVFRAQILKYMAILLYNNTVTVLQLLYRSTCVIQHFQLRTRGFCWCKVLLPMCPCRWQQVHSNKGEDAGVLFNSVIHTVSLTFWLFYYLIVTLMLGYFLWSQAVTCIVTIWNNSSSF